MATPTAAKLALIRPSKHLKGKITVPRVDENGNRVPRSHRRSAVKTIKLTALAARHHGEVWYVTSSFRTRAKQEELYRGFLAGKKGYAPANRPGTSKHELGLAIDVHYAGGPVGNSAKRRGTMIRLGFRFPFAEEPWHAQR